MGEMKWQPIEDAPIDVPVWLINRVMTEPVKGRWCSCKGHWVSVFTETSDGLWFPAERMVCPTSWAPIIRMADDA